MIPENKVSFLCLIVVSMLLISGFTVFLAHGYTTENEVEKNIEDDQDTSPSPMDSGGPDDKGYKWVNSTGSPSVSYNWKDAVTGGNATGLTDDNWTGPISLGFNFTYYGEVYNEVYIMSNGWISFVDQDTWYQGEDFPGPTNYQGVISPYSEDLDPSSQGDVYYKFISGNTDQFVITYYGVPNFGNSDNQTFQVVLNETGEIWFNYQSLDDYSANVGIENENSTIGLDYDSVASLSDGLSIKFEYEPPPYRVELSPEMQSKYSGTNTTIDHIITVSNRGTNNDTYTLSASNNTWPITFRDINDTTNITEISVNSEESKDFIARVSIPDTVSKGNNDIGDITATSQWNASVSDNSEIKTNYMIIPNNVAIFQSQDPWGITAIKDILTTSGIPYTVYGTNDIGVVNLSSYDKTIIVGGDGQDAEFYSVISDHKEWFENYTADGGVLNIHVDDWGDFNDIPCGLTSNHDNGNTVNITYPNHPFLTLPNNISDSELDDWGYSYHRYFTDWPAHADVVLTEGDTGNQWPVLLDSPLGKGRVIATGQTVEWGWYDGYSRILENIILAMNGTASLPSYALNMDPESQNDFGDPGTTVDHVITVNNMGAQNDTYTLSASNNTWPVTFRDIDDTTNLTNISVNAGRSKDFIARVSIPDTASEGDYDIGNITTTSQGNTSKIDTVQIKTNVYAPILLVDDDSGLKTEDWYMDALDANGYAYSYWNHSTQGTPSYGTLQDYNITIWFTGNSYGVNSASLDSSDRNALGNYLDDNGRLYLSSSLAGYDATYYGWSDWYNSYLHSSYDDFFSEQPTDMMGVPGDPISDDLNLRVYQGDHNEQLYGYTNKISPIHQGRVSYINTTNSFNSTIRADNGVYRTVHTSFDFAGVKGQGNRTTLMYRIIEWLNQSASDNISPDAPINPSPPDGATGVSTSPTLSVDVSDPDGDWMDVTFYDASSDTEIGQNTAVTNGTTSITWPGLATNTTYTWYAVADDGPNSTQSSTWTFTTRESSQNEAPSAPHNPNPADGATGVSISPTLSVDVSDPDGDMMDVRFIDASDNTLIGSNTGVPNGTTSITWSGLSENTDYQWYAIADDEGSEDGVPSSTWTFTTSGSGENEGPSAPYNPDPADGATGLNLNPTLSVNVSDPAGDTMDVTFYDASDSSVIGSNTMASNGTTSVMWSGLSEGMSYEWYATADDGEFNVTSSIWRFTTITSSENEGPSAPHNPDPDDGATGVSLSPTLTVDVSDPDGHEMIVTFYNSFGTEIDRKTGVTNGTCSVTWDGLDYNTDHSWYVVANDSIEENQSAVWTFQTMEDTTPPSVSINSPSEDSEVSNTSVTVEWTASDSDSGVDHYEIKLNEGEWIEVDGDTTYTFEGLSEGSHTVEVKAVDEEGNSATDSVAFVVEKGDESSTDITLFSYWWLLVILAVVVILILAVWHRRKKRPPEYQQPPGQQQQVPQQQQQPPQQEQSPPPSEKQGGKGGTPPPPPPES